MWLTNDWDLTPSLPPYVGEEGWHSIWSKPGVVGFYTNNRADTDGTKYSTSSLQFPYVRFRVQIAVVGSFADQRDQIVTSSIILKRCLLVQTIHPSLHKRLEQALHCYRLFNSWKWESKCLLAIYYSIYTHVFLPPRDFARFFLLSPLQWQQQPKLNISTVGCVDPFSIFKVTHE